MAMDLVDSKPVSPETFVKATAYIQQAFGVEYPAEKFSILFDMILDEGWTEARFKDTVKWFLKNKYNQAWSPSDWFQYGAKLYPWRHYREYCHEKNIREIDFQKTLQCYEVDGMLLWRENDGIDLPLKRVA